MSILKKPKNNEKEKVTEKEKQREVTKKVRAKKIREKYEENTSIMKQLMWRGTHGIDMGAMTIFH